MGSSNLVNRSSALTCSSRRTLDYASRPKSRGLARAFDAYALLAGPRLRARSSPERFWARVNKDGPLVVPALGACWTWTGRCHADGYGITTWVSVDIQTHRLAFALAHRALEAGEVVRHRCDNPPCCNPDHLLAGTIADNNRDMLARGRAVVAGVAAPGRSNGVANTNAKLTDDLVRELRSAWRRGESIKSIAARTGLAIGTVHPMLHGKTWRHVTDEAVAS